MELAYMQIFRDKRNSLRRISDVSRGALLAAMLDYAFDGIDAETLSDPVADALWPIYRDMLDQSRRSLEAKSNARRGGRAADEDPGTACGNQRTTEDDQRATDAVRNESKACQCVSEDGQSESKGCRSASEDDASVSGMHQDASKVYQATITPLSEGNQDPIREQSEPNQAPITDISDGNQKATRIKNQESGIKKQESRDRRQTVVVDDGTRAREGTALPDASGNDDLRPIQAAHEAVFAAAERAGFPMTAADMDKATAYMADYSPEWVLEAVRRASGGTKGQRCWRYVSGILRRWKAAGGMDAETRPDARSGAIARNARRVTAPAQEYTQRDYGADALDALFEDLTAEMRQ